MRRDEDRVDVGTRSSDLEGRTRATCSTVALQGARKSCGTCEEDKRKWLKSAWLSRRNLAKKKEREELQRREKTVVLSVVLNWQRLVAWKRIISLAKTLSKRIALTNYVANELALNLRFSLATSSGSQESVVARCVGGFPLLGGFCMLRPPPFSVRVRCFHEREIGDVFSQRIPSFLISRYPPFW